MRPNPDLLSPVNVPLIFSSGMSRRSDFLPALRANHSIGVDIGEMSANATNALAAAVADSTAEVFVDSGAFACFRAGLRGKPSLVDFAQVFERYDRLAHAVSVADNNGCGDAASRMHYVLPDVVGDQVASLAMLRKFADSARCYNEFANAIVPMQSGAMTLIEFYDAATVILNCNFLTIGVPSAEAAIDNDELMALLVARPTIFGVHVLGAASAKRAGPRLAVLRSVGFDGSVSLDANRLRTWWTRHSTRPEALARLIAGLPPKKAA